MLLAFEDHVIVDRGETGTVVDAGNFLWIEPRPDPEAAHRDWIENVAASVKGGDLEQGIADILSEFADIVYNGAPGERDPSTFIRRAEEYVFDHLRLEYPDAPESDLKSAAHGALLDYEVW